VNHGKVHETGSLEMGIYLWDCVDPLMVWT